MQPLSLLFRVACWTGLARGRLRTSARRAPAAAPTSVTVSYPVEREVTDYADFTARTAAVDSVEVRARVWGYLDKVNFKEGALVKKGDVLFEIDPRTYQAAVEQAQALVVSGGSATEIQGIPIQEARETCRQGGHQPRRV